MAEPENTRKKGTTVVKPIVYGNTAKYFGKKREEDGHTHSWTSYLRPFKNEDLSTFIKKVQFKLHESYTNPVSETGWGEFEVVIKIFFVDSTEKPLTIYHMLKLFQNDPAMIAGKKNVVSEHYDEIVFTDPSAALHEVLISSRQMVPAVRHEPDIDYKEIEEKTTATIAAAQKKIKQEIQELSDKLKMTRESIQTLKGQVDKAEEVA
ncbi:hypothetical protein EMCRGX_G016128 [Ephydatia muelleri]